VEKECENMKYKMKGVKTYGAGICEYIMWETHAMWTCEFIVVGSWKLTYW
jgi:hypothetical protein